jgi:hypothetical protein
MLVEDMRCNPADNFSRRDFEAGNLDCQRNRYRLPQSEAGRVDKLNAHTAARWLSWKRCNHTSGRLPVVEGKEGAD